LETQALAEIEEGIDCDREIEEADDAAAEDEKKIHPVESNICSYLTIVDCYRLT
jgi:hypothetical protein